MDNVMMQNDPEMNPGAIWYGPWYTGLIRGHFGHAGKKTHWAMALPGTFDFVSYDFNKERAFFPFTTKNSPDVLKKYSAGELPFGDPKKTTSLLFWRLVAAKDDLKKRFFFETNMPEKLYEEAMTAYRKYLENKKKKGSRQ